MNVMASAKLVVEGNLFVISKGPLCYSIIPNLEAMG